MTNHTGAPAAVIVKMIDLGFLQSNKHDAATKRAALVFTFAADARGGECKFLRYDSMRWDELFGCLIPIWKEPKTLTSHPMPFVHDADGFECDVFHALGTMWMLDNDNL